jgi:predicted NAD-dependent protein-ADP-ribosyltransferase YbiA (DUF1768 family)
MKNYGYPGDSNLYITWGCGTKGTEKNVLGKILMEVRSTLESEKSK